ncbi:MAG: peptidylprolyl isomerase [Planctomycetota bacterium]
MVTRFLPLVLGLASCFVSARSLMAVEEVKASHILLRDEAEAKKVSDEIAKSIAGGTDAKKAFSAACRKYSKDVTTKRQAGDLGWFPERGSSLDPLVVNAAFGLQPGEISGPIKTQFGWHLIITKERRDKKPPQPPVTNDPPTPPVNDPPKPPVTNDPPKPPTPPAKPVVSTPAVKAAGTRRTLVPSRIDISIQPAQPSSYRSTSRIFEPKQAVELNLVVKNGGSQEQKVPAPSLLALGFKLSQQATGNEIAGSFASITKPAAFFVPLKSYEITGTEISINDYFKDLYATGRFSLEWSLTTFFANLEKTFPDAKTSEGYADAKANLQKASVNVDKVRLDELPHWRRRRTKPFNFSILPQIKAGDSLFAQIKLSRQDKPVVIRLDTQQAQLRAAQHFSKLALDGFYDQLRFHEAVENDYLVGGCPLNRGTGAPSMSLPQVRNEAKVQHTAGTVSFVSRNVRSQGPARGGEIGSIFFVCFKDRPEWNDTHVPFGTVVEGLDILQKLDSSTVRSTTIESVTILPASEYKGAGAATTETGKPARVFNPEITIKTSKGDVKATLFESNARNTVSNFVSLADKGYYNKAKDGGKQKFFGLMTDEAGGRILIQAGSVTNDPEGEESYRIPDEVNGNLCTRGSLVMTKLWDPEAKDGAGGYAEHSASTQFFICLRDIPAYDHDRAFTVFGKVTAETLAVLDKLAEGDEITEVVVDKKRERDYGTFRKIVD